MVRACASCAQLRVFHRFAPYVRVCRGLQRFTREVDAKCVGSAPRTIDDDNGAALRKAHQHCACRMHWDVWRHGTCALYKCVRADRIMALRAEAFRDAVPHLPAALRVYVQHDSGYAPLAVDALHRRQVPLGELAAHNDVVNYALNETMDMCRLLVLQLCLARRHAGRQLLVDLLEEVLRALRCEPGAARMRTLMCTVDTAAAPPRRLRQVTKESS